MKGWGLWVGKGRGQRNGGDGDAGVVSGVGESVGRWGQRSWGDGADRAVE